MTVRALTILAMLLAIGRRQPEGSAPRRRSRLRAGGRRRGRGRPRWRALVLLIVSLGSLFTRIVPSMSPADVRAATVDDAAAWEERAIWWNRDWRYRVPVDILAPPGTALYDKQVTLDLDWQALLAELDSTDQQLDAASLRLVEYTDGGHIQYRQTDNLNRFDTLPIFIDGPADTTVEFLMAGETAAGERRRFFLYFDTTDNPKPAKDYHYYAEAQAEDYLAGYREGPDSEGQGATAGQQLKLFRAAGGDLSILQAGMNGQDFYVHYPLYKQYGDSTTYRGFKSASYSANLTPLYLDAEATFSGHDAGAGPQSSGSGRLRLSHLFKDGQPYSVLSGSVELVLNEDIRTAYISPILAALRSGGITGAWYTNDEGVVAPYDGQSADLCRCPDALIMQTSSARSEVFQLQELSYSSASFDYSALSVGHDAFKQYMRYASADNDWHAGDRISYQFRYIYTDQELGYAEMAPVLASLDASVTAAVGSPVAYSDALFQSQLYVFEERAWDYVIEQLAEQGWGQPWNIVYLTDTQTGERRPAHHQDSSMGAGFILYAATLKAAMSGEERYYRIADRYAKYFLQLEATDVAQHGATAAGRISYFYNGSQEQSYFDVPPGRVKDTTSFDQTMTAGLGLWSYYQLDSARIQHHQEVGRLLVRMGDYTRTQPQLVDDIANIGVMLGEREGWTTRAMEYDLDGSSYRQWVLNDQPQRILTGAGANNFFINAMRDKLQPNKDPAELRERYRGATADLGTVSKGLYELERGRSYPASWGYVWDEFVAGQTYQSTNYDALQVDPDASPSHYVDLSSHGGARDSTDGRGSTEDAAVAMWAALHDPAGRMPVAEDVGPRYIDYATDAIHSAIALLMTDEGAMREAYQGTLGRNSAVTSHVVTADFSGYFLTLMAYYRLYQGAVANPMPLDQQDYIQGVAETDGTLRVSYLGSGELAQTLVVPADDQPILADGVYQNPVLTVQADGAIAELVGGRVELAAQLPERELAVGEVRQVPLWLDPLAGEISVAVLDWSPTSMRWSEASVDADERVDHTVAELLPGQRYRIAVDGERYAEAVADAQGQLSFTYAGGYSTHVFSITPVDREPAKPTSAGAPAPSRCTSPEPGGAPALYAALPEDAGRIRLFVGAPAEPYDRYVVLYGTAPGDYRFGADPISGSGAASFSIGALAPGTTYYFRVRAGNGCATGAWSNELAARTLSGQAAAHVDIALSAAGPMGGAGDERPADDTDGDDRYALRVRVVDQRGRPLAGVRLKLGDERAQTDARGQAHLRLDEAGAQRLVLSHAGESITRMLYLNPSDAGPLAITVEWPVARGRHWPLLGLIAVPMAVLALVGRRMGWLTVLGRSLRGRRWRRLRGRLQRWLRQRRS